MQYKIKCMCGRSHITNKAYFVCECGRQIIPNPHGKPYIFESFDWDYDDKKDKKNDKQSK